MNILRRTPPRGRARSAASRLRWALLALAGAATTATLALAAPALAASGGQTGFGFNAAKISGFPTGAVSLTGGGTFNLGTMLVDSGGGFRCTDDVLGTVPLNGCLTGQGVRWDTEALLASTGFKCTGATSEAPKTATTGHGTVVLQSDFYRAGDGTNESFHAQLIVSQNDIAPDIPGVQNVWVQGVGCGSAIVHFSLPS
jgi:hypothetical protein